MTLKGWNYEDLEDAFKKSEEEPELKIYSFNFKWSFQGSVLGTDSRTLKFKNFVIDLSNMESK